jgi:hypothetical protein
MLDDGSHDGRHLSRIERKIGRLEHCLAKFDRRVPARFTLALVKRISLGT